jgi:hypothetical protein
VGEVRSEALVPEIPKDDGIITRILGPGFIRVSRVVPGPTGALEKRLEEYFAEGESLRRVRKRGDRSLWEPASGVRAILRRALKSVDGSSYDLVRARTVELSVVALEGDLVLVTMTADVRSARNAAGGGGAFGMGLGGGITGTVVGVALGVPLIALPALLAGMAGGTAIGRATFAKEAARIRRAMEGILDRLEAGEPLAPLRTRDWRTRFAR